MKAPLCNNPDTGARRRPGVPFLVIMNPIGGNGQAHGIYENGLKPLLSRAGIPHQVETYTHLLLALSFTSHVSSPISFCVFGKVILTQYKEHAREICAHLDTGKVGALVLISGDGMVHECMQGLAVDLCKGDPARLRSFFHACPLGFVAGGSSCGLAASFGIFSPLAGCLAVVNGQPCPLDVQEVAISPHSNSSAGRTPCSSSSSSFSFGGKKLTEEGARNEKNGVVVWEILSCCFGVIADHDRFAEGSFRIFGVTLKSMLAPLAVIVLRQEYACRLEVTTRAMNYVLQQEDF